MDHPTAEHTFEQIASWTHGELAPLLVNEDRARTLLSLEDDHFQWLVNTQQIIPIKIAGTTRYDYRDLARLVQSYKNTAERRETWQHKGNQ